MNNLPPGWQLTTLYEVATWGSGGTPKRTIPDYYEGEVPWAVIGDLNDAVVTDTAESITVDGLTNSSAKVVPAGAVLLAMYGSIGKLGISGVPMATNQAIAFAVPHPGVLRAQYLFHYLYSQRAELSSVGKGATQKNISQTVLRSWPMPLPPRVEQDRIVAAIQEHLSRLDAAEAALHAADARLNLLESRAIDEAFMAFDSRVPVGDLAEVRGGIQKQPKRKPRACPTPFLRVANVGRGRIELGEVHEIELFEGELERYRLQPGDLLVVEGNGSPDQIGRSAVWRGEIEDCVHQNHLIRVRHGPKLNADFLDLYWNAPSTRAQLTAVASSTSGLHTLSTAKVKKIKVPVLPLDEQRAVVEALTAQIEAFAHLRAALRTARRRQATLRHAILTAAFSGQLVPQNPDNERASVLIDRTGLSGQRPHRPESPGR